MKNIVKIMIGLIVSLFVTSSVNVHAASLEEIQEKGELVVGMNAEYPPFEWVEMVDGQPHYLGIDVALGQAIADEIGVDLVIDNRAFDSLIPSLQTKKIDIIISGMAHTEERAQQVDFSVPYFKAISQFAVPVDQVENYQTIEDFNGKNLGVLKGSIQETYARENMPEVELTSVNKNGDLLELLKAKKVDAVLMSDLSLNQYVVQYSDVVGLVEGIEIESDGVGSSVAIPKDNPELVATIDQVIADLIQSGEMDKIFEEYSTLAGESTAE